MYKVFVNGAPLILTNRIADSEDIKYFPLNKQSVLQVVDNLAKQRLEQAYIYHPNGEDILRKFTKAIPMVEAAGGVVTNEKGKVLFIYREDKWDLPKGKIEKGESVETAAVREVEEETGVKKLKLENFLRTTYHIFKRNGTYKLKVVHWYAMRTNYKGELKPQCSEGIEKVKWKNPEQIQKALKNSWANIITLFQD